VCYKSAAVFNFRGPLSGLWRPIFNVGSPRRPEKTPFPPSGDLVIGRSGDPTVTCTECGKQFTVSKGTYSTHCPQCRKYLTLFPVPQQNSAFLGDWR
jgi:hypothetical protein